MALSREGGVYTWGNGLMGALGHGTRENELAPRLVSALWERGQRARAICACAHLSGALADEGGAVFAWGWDGCEATPCDKTPVRQRALDGVRVVQLAAGAHHFAALAADGGVASWGTRRTLRAGMLVEYGARGGAGRARVHAARLG